jgi:hypothetical protein
MKNYVNIHKYGTTGTVLLFIYIVSMALMPLFHIHPDKDHHDIKGSNYHSHHIPIHSNESDEADHENHHQIPEDFFLESLNLLHPLYAFSQSNDRLSSKTFPNLAIQYILDADFSLSRKDCKPLKDNHRQTLFSPQKANLVLFSANTSPPLA